MAGMLKEKGILRGKGGMELDVVPVSVFQRFASITGFDAFTDISGLIKALRIVKSPFEIEQVRKSGAICDAVFAYAPNGIREGAREIDIDAALVAVGRQQGHQGFLRMRGFNQEMMNLYVTSGLHGDNRLRRRRPCLRHRGDRRHCAGLFKEDGREGYPGAPRLRRRIQRLYYRRDQVLRGRATRRDVPASPTR